MPALKPKGEKEKNPADLKPVKVPEKLPYNVGIFYCDKPLTPDDKEKLEECSKFYTDAILRDILIPLTTQQYKLSLRSLDWLVTNYSKKNHIIYMKMNKEKSNFDMVNIYNDYGDALRRNHRKKFDAFRRRTRIYFRLDDEWHETTVGQLLFLKWMRETNVLEYAESHIDEINSDMSRVSHINKKDLRNNKAKGQRRKRKELSKRPNVSCVAFKMQCVTKFDDPESEPEEHETDRSKEGKMEEEEQPVAVQ
jgi:hypothetical protein